MNDNTPVQISQRSTDVSPALELIWSRFNLWDVTAGHKKRTLTTWRWRVLVFIIVGAMCGVLSSSFALPKVDSPLVHQILQIITTITALLSSALIGVAAFAGSEILTDELEKHQTSARMVAEALRSDAYLYIFRASPYDQDILNTPFDRINTHTKMAADVETESITREQELKNVPNPSMTIDEYIKSRIEDQVYGYYLPKIKSLQQKIRAGKNYTFALGLAGVVLGALGAIGEFGAYATVWIAFVTSASASIASYMATNRYQFLIVSYQTTVGHLQILLARWKQQTERTDAVIRDFVVKFESEFTREIAAWQVEMNRELDEKEDLSKVANKVNQEKDQLLIKRDDTKLEPKQELPAAPSNNNTSTEEKKDEVRPKLSGKVGLRKPQKPIIPPIDNTVHTEIPEKEPEIDAEG